VISQLLQSCRLPLLIQHVLASEKDVDIAVAAARRAFRETWGKNVSGFERSRLINKLADLMERDKQILAELECLNNGKPVTIARCVSNLIPKVRLSLFLLSRDSDIGDSIGCLRYYAGWADKIVGEVCILGVSLL
jgi:aldehyde dehydrogenase (NAD+)